MATVQGACPRNIEDKSKQKQTYFGVAQECDDGDEIARNAEQGEEDTSANGEMKQLVRIFGEERLKVVLVRPRRRRQADSSVPVGHPIAYRTHGRPV